VALERKSLEVKETQGAPVFRGDPSAMLEDQADRHKLRWIALIAVILAVVIGFAFAKWASENKPLGSHISSPPALSLNPNRC
jgi:hypothetical protein